MSIWKRAYKSVYKKEAPSKKKNLESDWTRFLSVIFKAGQFSQMATAAQFLLVQTGGYLMPSFTVMHRCV